MVTSPPGEGFRPCDLSHDRRATSCVLPSSGDATFWPFRSAADLMTYFVIRYAPPDVAPEMILIAPLEVRKALTAGLGPMKAASSAPDSRAVTSSGPALKVPGLKSTPAPRLLVKIPSWTPTTALAWVRFGR